LFVGYKDIVLTDEQLKGREIQANKRRQLALEKTEKHKVSKHMPSGIPHAFNDESYFIDLRLNIACVI